MVDLKKEADVSNGRRGSLRMALEVRGPGIMLAFQAPEYLVVKGCWIYSTIDMLSRDVLSKYAVLH